MPIICLFFVFCICKAPCHCLRSNEHEGVFAGAYITNLLGKSTDAGNLGSDFAMLAVIVFVALIIQLSFLRPKFNDFVGE